MKKRRYWILGSIGTLLAIVTAGAGVLLETQAGLRWAVGFAQSHSGGALKIGQADGHLAGPFTLKQVHVDLSGTVIRANKLSIDWRPFALLLGEVDIKRLQGSGISAQPSPGASPSKNTSAGLPKSIKLPVSVRVAEASMSNVTWNDAGHSLHLATLNFSLAANTNRIHLGRLQAHGPTADVEGTLLVQPHGRWIVNADLSSRIHMTGYPEIAGHTQLHGAMRGTLSLKQRLTAPFGGELEAKASHLFGNPKLKGRLHIAKLDPHRIKAAWPRLETGAKITFDGSLRQFGAQGSISLAGQGKAERTFNLNLAAGLQDASIRIHHLNVAMSGSPAKLTLRGHLDTQAPYSTQATLAWQSLQWPLGGNHPTLYAPSGRMNLGGTLDKWRLDIVTLLGARGVPTGRWALSAHGDQRSATLDALAGLWLGGTINGQGYLDFQARRPFRITLHTRNLQAAGLISRITGHAGFDLTTSGQLDPLRADAKLSALQGRLNGQPLKGHADLRYSGTTLGLNSFDVAVGPNHMQANGSWDKSLALDWTLDAPQLAALYPQLEGVLKANGSVSGSFDTPHLVVQAQAEKLLWRSLGIGRMQFQGDLDFANREKASFMLKLENLETPSLTVSQLNATLSGPAKEQRISLSILSNQGDFTLEGKGSVSEKGWTGQLISGELRPLKQAPFTLDSPARLSIAGKTIELARNCWHNPHRSEFCTALQSGASGWNARIELHSLSLALANPYLQNGLSMQGSVNGKIQAERSQNGLQMTGEVHAGAGSLMRSLDGQPQRLDFAEAGIEARLDPAMATARLGVVLKDGGLLDAALDIPWRDHAKPAGHLRLKASLPDLSGLAALSPYVSHVGGRLFADLDISGSLQNPRFGGRLQLSQLQARLPRLGSRFDHGNLQLQGKGNALSLEGKVYDMHEGQLAVNGVLKYENTWHFNANVKGKDFNIANIPEASLSVSPDLQVSVNGRAISLKGSVKVPTARIKPPHFSGAIAPSPDLVIVGENDTNAPKWTLAAQLRIQLGEQVYFDGYGLTGRIGGELDLHDSPGHLTTGSGELKILDGQYKAYGQDLTIERGRLLFSGGPVTNPGLDMRAIRKVGIVTAGLQVTGTLRSPKLQVFSDPPMTQSDALAYLLFGHGINQTSGSEQSTLNQAANAIGIAGGTLLAKAVGKQVGVDTVSVENASPYSTNTSQASLFLGKYLSPRLYVSYGIGLYQPINLLRIRYTLSRHWALEAESGTISGADILYTIGQ